jgi:CxxC-x17-CxxC domain-containing protein
MSDQQITCAECGNIFVFSASEQAFYSERGLASPPKRCKACRQARRASGEGGGGAGGGRGFRDRGPRMGGNQNEYRSPMSNGNGYGGGGGGREGRPSWGGEQGGAGRGPGNGPPRGAPRGNRPPRFDQGGGFHAPRSAPAARSGGESSWGTRPNERRPRPSEGGNERPPSGYGGEPRGGPRGPRGPRGDRAPAPPRETKPNERPPGTRPERPKYDITCAECGTQAQVPFKPLEGRQVFCQPCYRARKGTPAAGGEATATDDNDTGIVE